MVSPARAVVECCCSVGELSFAEWRFLEVVVVMVTQNMDELTAVDLCTCDKMGNLYCLFSYHFRIF